MKCLALIPARSGSKGIPHKNIRPVAGKPLLAWSIGHALAANRINRVIVSTDSEDYAEIARQYGAETPFIRPDEFATDESTDLDVFQHAIGWLMDHEGYEPEICVHLRPTCPLRKNGVIDEIVEILTSRPEIDSVRTVTPVIHPPYKMWRRSEIGLLDPLIEVPGLAEPWNEPRQKLPPTYLQTANIDAVRCKVIREYGSMTGKRIFGFVESGMYDIDTPYELEKISLLLEAENSVGSQQQKRHHTLCFDIDGVIASIAPENDYNLSLPRERVIGRIRQFHQMGYRIILFTARGTMTGIDWRLVTEKQMREWQVPYDELCFGKPAADYYIDDRALRPNELDQIP
jgi:CMP-N,N'-diacetyllegionaminic acid synthase